MPTSGLAPVGSWMETLGYISIALWPLKELFVFFGVIGVYCLLDGAGVRLRRLAAVSLAVIGVRAALFIWLFSRDWIFGWPDPYYPTGFFNSEAFFFLVGYGGPIGIVLVGVASLRARGLGVFRFFPIVIGILSTPLVDSLIFRVYSGGESYVMEWSVWLEVLTASPIFLSSLGWIAIGAAMFGANEREARIIGREKRETEERNLALARRLYEEAWGNEKLSVADEVLSEDFFDRRRNRGGASAFKQAISDLHHAFPDLKVEIAEQSAEGDEVFIRIAFSGTDKGGVLWYPPTNETATFTGAFTDRFGGDGKLIEHGGELDEDSLMKQLGHPSEK